MGGSGKSLIAEERARLEAKLATLGVDGEEIKNLAVVVAELAIEATSTKLLGIDVSIAEQALKAATRNLIAASELRVAQGVFEVVQEILRVASRALVGGVLASL